jgi:hypothetical protein
MPRTVERKLQDVIWDVIVGQGPKSIQFVPVLPCRSAGKQHRLNKHHDHGRCRDNQNG